MSVLKLEPFSGISGDMMLGALAMADGDMEQLKQLPKKLHLEDVEIAVEPQQRCGIECLKIDIISHKNQTLRHLPEINRIIEAGNFPKAVKMFAQEAFLQLAKAEAKVHGIPVEKVHFHEVGAIDTICDIVGSAYLLDKLNITRTISDPICVGSGMVKCEHGIMPIPAPATAELLTGMPTYPGQCLKEMTTPTGAAILKTLRPEFAEKNTSLIGGKLYYGAGSYNLPQLNCLRISISEQNQALDDSKEIWVVKTNIDDMSAELLGTDFQNLLFETGALEVTLQPVTMKKGRLGTTVEVLCRENKLRAIAETLLQHTSTLGIRYFKSQRLEIPRYIEQISTKWGTVAVKCARTPLGEIRRTPEYEDCKRLAALHNISTKKVYDGALNQSLNLHTPN